MWSIRVSKSTHGLLSDYKKYPGKIVLLLFHSSTAPSFFINWNMSRMCIASHSVSCHNGLHIAYNLCAKPIKHSLLHISYLLNIFPIKYNA